MEKAMTAQVILFKDAGFQGDHKHVFNSIENLATQDGGFNDKTSSIAVIEGNWEFYRDWKWENSLGILGPGAYSSVTAALGANTNDVITGVRLVSDVSVIGGTRSHHEREKA